MSSMIGQTMNSPGMRNFMSSTGGGTGNKIPKGYEQGRIQNYSPEQMQLFQSLFSNLGPDSFLSKLAGGDEETFSQMEAPAMRQFAGMQGNLASRFSGMGMGGRRSSGFQNTMNQAGSDFVQQLQSRRMDLQRQAMKDLHGMSTDLLNQKPYDQFMVEKETPFWQKLLGGGLGIAGGAVGGALGGPAGAMIGGQIGSRAGKAFL